MCSLIGSWTSRCGALLSIEAHLERIDLSSTCCPTTLKTYLCNNPFAGFFLPPSIPARVLSSWGNVVPQKPFAGV